VGGNSINIRGDREGWMGAGGIVWGGSKRRF